MEGTNREFGMDMYTWIHVYMVKMDTWITSKDMLYSTGNSTQYYVVAWMGGEFGGD